MMNPELRMALAGFVAGVLLLLILRQLRFGSALLFPRTSVFLSFFAVAAFATTFAVAPGLLPAGAASVGV